MGCSFKYKSKKKFYSKINKNKKIKKNYKKKNSKKTLKKKIKMKGGGLPLFGSVKNLIGLTNKKVVEKEGMIDNLCSLNNITKSEHPLTNTINEICNINQNIKEENKNSNVVTSVFKF